MKPSLVQIVAQNLRKAFDHQKRFESQRALAKDADVAPNTVKNLMDPSERAPTKRGETAPRLDVLERIANSMGYQAWELMVESFDPDHPFDRPITKREAEVYSKIRDAYAQMPPVTTLFANEPEPPAPPPRAPARLPGVPMSGTKLIQSKKRARKKG